MSLTLGTATGSAQQFATVQRQGVSPNKTSQLRNRQPCRRRPDALESLTYGESSRSKDGQQCVRTIVCATTCINAICWNTCWNHHIRVRTDDDGVQSLDGFTILESEFGELNEELYTERLKSKIRSHLQASLISEDEVIHTATQIEFYKDVLRHHINECRNFKPDAAESSDFDNPKQRLGFLLTVIQELSRVIKVAGRKQYLEPEQLESLRLKMDALDIVYPKAYSTLHGKTGQQLVNLDKSNWWDVDLDSLGDEENSGSAGTKAARPSTHESTVTSTNEDVVSSTPETTVISTHKEQYSSTKPSFVFIVPVVCLVSAIPAALAVAHSAAEPGTNNDSDFWQSVSNCVLQVLSITTFVWMIWHDSRLNRVAWFWIWVGSGFSAASAVLSVPLYLVLPTGWSFAVGFAGTVVQAVVQLQVVGVL